MNVEDRKRQVRIHGYCKNCLARSHSTSDCTSADVCQKCGWAHHTLLHQPRQGSTIHNSEQQQSSRHISTRNDRNPPRQRRNNIHTRLGPYRRPSPQPRQRAEQTTGRNRHSSYIPTANPRRVLLGALRALERLAKTL